MFKKLKSLFLLLIVSLLVTACGSDLEEVEDSTDNLAPDWFQEPTEYDENWFFGVGTATSRNIQVGLDRARANAKKQLSQSIAERVKVRTQNVVEEFGQFEDDDYELSTLFEETSTAVSETAIVNTILHKRKMTRFKDGTRWFVCLKVKKNDIAEITKKTLKNFSKKFKSESNRKRLESIAEQTANDDFFDN